MTESDNIAAKIANSWLPEIRQHLANPAPKRLGPSEKRSAAVLVPLYVEGGQLWTLLTRRADDLPTHRSQIAFPGGNTKANEELWDTALREAHEEVGIDRGKVLKLGQLDELDSTTGFRVVPCVGALPAQFETSMNPGEIAEIFRVPLYALANPQLIEDRLVSIDGKEQVMRVYHVGSRQIWGLTARILQNLLQRLGLEATESE